jgi:hypothetical protein
MTHFSPRLICPKWSHRLVLATKSRAENYNVQMEPKEFRNDKFIYIFLKNN